jgi:hypothetical protein
MNYEFTAKLKDLLKDVPLEELDKYIGKEEREHEIRRLALVQNISNMWNKAGTEARLGMLEHALATMMQCFNEDTPENLIKGSVFISMAVDAMADTYARYYVEGYKKSIAPDNEELERMLKL